MKKRTQIKLSTEMNVYKKENDYSSAIELLHAKKKAVSEETA